MLTISESIGDDGTPETVTLDARDGELLVQIDDGAPLPLPEGAIDHVMTRYGKPLAAGILLDGPRLDLGGGATLHLLRHRARYDVIARDFLVWSVPGREPLAELAIAVTGALVHLARLGAASDEPA